MHCRDTLANSALDPFFTFIYDAPIFFSRCHTSHFSFSRSHVPFSFLEVTLPIFLSRGHTFHFLSCGHTFHFSFSWSHFPFSFSRSHFPHSFLAVTLPIFLSRGLTFSCYCQFETFLTSSHYLVVANARTCREWAHFLTC